MSLPRMKGRSCLLILMETSRELNWTASTTKVLHWVIIWEKMKTSLHCGHHVSKRAIEVWLTVLKKTKATMTVTRRVREASLMIRSNLSLIMKRRRNMRPRTMPSQSWLEILATYRWSMLKALAQKVVIHLLAARRARVTRVTRTTEKVSK